jgi:Bacterial lectin
MTRSVSFLLALCAVGCSSPTTLTVNLLATNTLSISAMEAQIDTVDSKGQLTSQTVPFSGAGLQLPARFVITLPALPALVTVAVTGKSTDGRDLDASEMTMSVPHQNVQLSFWLDGAPGSQPNPPPTTPVDAGVPLDFGGTGPTDAGSGGLNPDLAGCGSCAAPSICCGNVCVDPTRDPNHCGGCGNACPAADGCGATLAASMTDGTAPANWHFNMRPGSSGGAFYDPSADLAVLTNDTTGQTATLLYNHPIVTDSFDASFDFRISVSSFPYADGMAFVLIKNNSAVADIDTAVGFGGGGFGMMAPSPQNSNALLSGYGVELDTYDNDYPNGACGETVNGDHVNIDTLASCATATNGNLPTPLAQPQYFQLADGAWHTVQLHLAGGQLSVAIKTGTTVQTLFTNVPLTGFNSGDSYFYGFSGATGGFGERAEVRNVAVQFPTARCL